MKIKKLSGYQKIKADNLALKEDIHRILKGNFKDKLLATTKWNAVFDTENMIMAGSHWSVREGNGIWSQIKNGDIVTFNKVRNDGK